MNLCYNHNDTLLVSSLHYIFAIASISVCFHSSTMIFQYLIFLLYKFQHIYFPFLLHSLCSAYEINQQQSIHYFDFRAYSDDYQRDVNEHHLVSNPSSKQNVAYFFEIYETKRIY